MKTKSVLFPLVAVLAGCFSVLRAEDPPQPPPGGPRGNPEEFFKRMDANNDGKITKEEFLAFAKKEAEERFKQMDTSGDGKMDKKEIAAAVEKMKEHMNPDGKTGPKGKGQKPARN